MCWPEDTLTKQVPIFFNVIGSSKYGILRSLLAPDDPKGKSLADLKKVLKDHFEPKRSIVAERFHFHRRDQRPSETIADYVAELHWLASKCAFDRAYLDEVLRDRFVCGLLSEATQRKLLGKDEVKFSKAVEIAQSLEAAHKDSQALKASPTPDLSVGAVTLQTSVASSKAACAANVPPHGNLVSRPCTRCGKVSRNPRLCPFREAVCHRCRKKGHLARASVAERANRCQQGQVVPTLLREGPVIT